MTRKLKRKAGRQTLFVPESVSHEQALQIVRETAVKNTSDEFDTAFLEERLNQILDIYAVERATPTKKQSSAAVLAVRLALRALVNELPEPGTVAFRAIVAAGDEFARRHGEHSGLSPIHHPASRSIPAPASANRRMVPTPPATTDYRTAERLGDTFAYVKALSEWLHNLPIVPGRTRRTSPIVWLIGGGLPTVFEDTFNKKFGNGRIGPGARFVKAVLSISGRRSPISEETIKTYRTEWLKAKNRV